MRIDDKKRKKPTELKVGTIYYNPEANYMFPDLLHAPNQMIVGKNKTHLIIYCSLGKSSEALSIKNGWDFVEVITE